MWRLALFSSKNSSSWFSTNCMYAYTAYIIQKTVYTMKKDMLILQLVTQSVMIGSSMEAVPWCSHSSSFLIRFQQNRGDPPSCSRVRHRVSSPLVSALSVRCRLRPSTAASRRFMNVNQVSTYSLVYQNLLSISLIQQRNEYGKAECWSGLICNFHRNNCWSTAVIWPARTGYTMRKYAERNLGSPSRQDELWSPSLCLNKGPGFVRDYSKSLDETGCTYLPRKKKGKVALWWCIPGLWTRKCNFLGGYRDP
jgi:hypothetical protein